MIDVGELYAPAMGRMDGVTTPSLADFAQLSRDRRVVPLVRRLLADGRTPVDLYQSLTGSGAGTFLLESAENGRSWSRYSFIGVRCQAMLTGDGDEAIWVGDVPTELEDLVKGCHPLEAMRKVLAELHSQRIASLPPLTSGLVGMISYDAVRRWETLPDANPEILELPEIAMLLATDLVVYDHFDGSVLLVANAIIGSGQTQDELAGAYAQAQQRLDEMLACLAAPSAASLSTMASPDIGDVTSDTTRESYYQKVENVREHIYSGDAFQVVVSQRFQRTTDASALDIYRVLRVSNPSPYMYLVRFPGFPNQSGESKPFDVVGSSPEALVKLTGSEAMLHPIAGTRRRGATPEEDQDLADDLLSDDKERAEHLMLVDLGRNDLGRVCEPGTVEVVEFMEIERYSHVMHIVSTVVGQLTSGSSAYDLLAATFPAGTLSGAPKPMAMKIIDAQESSRRGLYGGCIGYLDFAGDMDTAIAIRTAVLRDNIAYVQAGAGLVADSDQQAEYEECQSKAAAVLRAIEKAGTLRKLSM